MRYYRRKRYTNQTAKKVFLRLLFVLMAAVIITVLTTLLGYHLKQTVADAEQKIDSAETSKENASGNLGLEYDFSNIPDRAISLTALAVDPFPTENTDTEIDNTEQMDPLADFKPNFDAVAVNLTANGVLVYLSPARMSFAGLSTEELQNDGAFLRFEQLRDFAFEAKTSGFRMCAVMDATRNTDGGALFASADKVMLEELAELGFDEVLLTGLTPLTDESLVYLSSLVSDDIQVGAVFSFDDYMDQRNEKRLRLLSAAGILLCVELDPEMSGNVEETTTECYTSLRNADSIYQLRYVLSSEISSVLRRQYAVLSELGVPRLVITTPISPLDFAEDDFAETESIETEAPPETDAPLNPYATTRGDSDPTETTENSDPKNDPAYDEDVFRGDDAWWG